MLTHRNNPVRQAWTYPRNFKRNSSASNDPDARENTNARIRTANSYDLKTMLREFRWQQPMIWPYHETPQNMNSFDVGKFMFPSNICYPGPQNASDTPQSGTDLS